jgi:hypothetical protein
MKKPTLLWIRNIESDAKDRSFYVAVDQKGNLFTCGTEIGEFALDDVYVAKYDSTGQRLWRRIIESNVSESAHGVTTDRAGDVIICGSTRGVLEEGVTARGEDVFLAKYNTEGKQLWLRQFDLGAEESAYEVITDHLDNVYVCGSTRGDQPEDKGDTFIAKYSSEGVEEWRRQIITPWRDGGDAGIAVDYLGNLFICGRLPGQGGDDFYISKYDPNGDRIWNRNLGTAEREFVGRIAVDQLGNIFISGNTLYVEEGGDDVDIDTFISKYDPLGREIWTQRLDNVPVEVIFELEIDSFNNIIVAGAVQEDAYDEEPDIFLAKYDSNGDQLWLQRLGTPYSDRPYDVTVDGIGNIYLGGYTFGPLGAGQTPDSPNAFLAKFADDLSLANHHSVLTNHHILMQNKIDELEQLIKKQSPSKKIPPTKVWLRQIGTRQGDYALGVDADYEGNVVICGFTGGELEEGQDQGQIDAFLVKYNSQGRETWRRQIGTASGEAATGVATDPWNNIFICGYTGGELEAVENQGSVDAFLTKYNAQGEPVWTRQFGTLDVDVARSVATDRLGNAFVCGYTKGAFAGKGAAQGGSDLFLAKYDPQGQEMWLKQIEKLSYDLAEGLAVDPWGNVLLCGSTSKTQEGQRDILLAKYNSSGDQMWLRQLRTNGGESAKAIDTDRFGNVFISGYTSGALGEGQPQGLRDIFIAKFDLQGNQVWLRQFGTSRSEEALGIATDYDGNVAICGYAEGALIENSFYGIKDAFIAKFDTQGSLQWIESLGTSAKDQADAIAIDRVGNLFICGYTKGYLEEGQSQGASDIFVAKYVDDFHGLIYHELLSKEEVVQF